MEVLTTFVESVEIEKNISKIETSKRGEIMPTMVNKKFYDLKYDLVFKSIIVDDNDYTIMNNILSDILEKEVKVKRYLNSELKIKNKKIKGTRLDIIAETTEGVLINIELNINYDKNIKERNLNYYATLYTEGLEKGNEYIEIKEIIQINLNFNEGKNETLKEEYLLRNKEGKILVKNFRIINVNIAGYKEKWYYKNIKGDKRHIYLTMLGSNKEEIKELAKKDKKVKEVEEKMLKFNEDGTITNLMTPEEEDALMERIIRRNAYEDGVKKGMKMASKDTIKNTAISMIERNYPLKDISEITKLSIKELKKLQKEK